MPRWIEPVVWLGLITSGWLTVTNVKETNARFLTDSVTWAAGQIVNTSFALGIASLKVWLVSQKFEIASAVLVLVFLDILLLALLRSHRQATKSMPRVKLGEWFELPRPALAEPKKSRVARPRRQVGVRVKAARHGKRPRVA